MPLYIDEASYPHDYDWLPADKQQAIIDYLNDLRDRSLRTFRLSRSSICKKSEHKDFIERRWRELSAKEDACLDLLDFLGIKVESGWVGHCDGYFLATYNDALAQQDYYDDIACDDEGDVDQYISGGNYENE